MRNVVFDLGNVLIDFLPQQIVTAVSSDLETQQRLLAAVFASPEWLMLDRGVINQQQAIERLSHQHLDLSTQIACLFGLWFSGLRAIPSTVEYLQKLKNAGIALYALSNFHREAFAYVYQRYDWFALFDGMVISYQVQALKPEPAIYLALLKNYQLTAKESLFIDDSQANIEGARQCGLATIHYCNPRQFSEELRTYFTFL